MHRPIPVPKFAVSPMRPVEQLLISLPVDLTNLLIKDGLGEGEAMKLTRHLDRCSFKRYTNKKEVYAAQVAVLKASGQLS